MSKYYTNFETSSIGSAPAGWTPRWAAVTAPTNHVLAVRYGTPVVKRRVLNYYQAVASYPGMYSFDAVDADANRGNVEVLMAVKRETRGSPDTPASIIINFVRASGASGSQSAYRFEIRYPDASSSANTLLIVKDVAGVTTSIAGVTIPYTVDTSKHQFLRFSAQDLAGSPSRVQLRLRAWDEGSVEPTVWHVDTTDASLYGAVGWVGTLCYADYGKGSANINFFSVATNGDSAFTPKTNTEYSAWLDSVAQRRVLFDITARGYDPTGLVGGSPTTLIQPLSFYVANGGFTTKDWDSPANRNYSPWVTKIPTFKREMGTALSGQATTSFGSMTVSNPRQLARGPGVRDDWLRMKWDRSYVRMYLGDPSWSKHDFRLILWGRLGQPRAPNVSGIEFPLFDLGDILDAPFQRNLFDATNAATYNKTKPVAIGHPEWCDLQVLDVASGTYFLTDGSMDGGSGQSVDGVSGTVAGGLYDNGAPLFNFSAVTADPATDTIGFTNHGGLNGWRCRVLGFPAPTGLTNSVDYYMVNKTASTFQLSLTRGGAAINFTTTGTSVSATIYGYWVDQTAKTVALESNPVGRITAGGIYQADSYGGSAGYAGNMLAYTIFTKGGISLDHKDETSFATLAATGDIAGLYTSLDNPKIKEVVSKIAAGTNSWFTVSPDGRIQVGQIGLPASTSVLTLLESDVKDISLRESILPYNFNTCSFSYLAPNLVNGPMSYKPTASATQFTPVEKKTHVPWDYTGSAVPPIDGRPDLGPTSPPKPFDTIFCQPTTEQARLVALFKRTLGIFECTTRLKATELSIGDTITLTHSRLGWKTYGGTDPTSPDSATTFDATKAVVLGIEVNLSSKSPFPVRLILMRQIPGYYPTSAVQ